MDADSTRRATGFQVAQLHRQTAPSMPLDARSRPSALKETDVTVFVWPLSSVSSGSSKPWWCFQTLTVRSSEADARRFPHGAHTMAMTRSECPAAGTDLRRYLSV